MELNNQTEFAVIDTETTGLDLAEDRVCEVAVVKTTAQTQGDCTSSFIDPGVPVKPTARAVHHIPDELLRGQPSLSDWLASTDMTGIPVAHNAAFDSAFMPMIPGPWLCTYRIALHLWPEADAHNNQVLRYWLPNLVCDPPSDLHPHRALYDAIVTAAILRYELAECKRRDLQFGTVDELIEWANAPALLHKMPVGEKRGQPWADQDTGFLQWMRKKGEQAWQPDVWHTLLHEMARR